MFDRRVPVQQRKRRVYRALRPVVILANGRRTEQRGLRMRQRRRP